MNERYKPIDQANTQKVRFSVPLPEYVDRERVGINVGRIEKLCRIGGIGHLRIVGETQGKTSSFTPAIVGFSNKGEAYAAKTGVKNSVPTYSVDYERDEFVPHSFRWANGTVRVNLNEVADRIVSDLRWKKDAREIKAWSQHLDLSLRRGIAEIGTRHLIVEANKAYFTITTLVGALIAFGLIPPFDPRVPETGRIIFSIAAQHQIMNAIDFVSGKFSHLGEHRWSITNGAQPDRAILLKVLTDRGNLVKTLPKPKEA